MLESDLARNSVLGVGWGTSVAAVVQRLPMGESIGVKVVQLVAALGARNLDFDGHAIVRQVVERLGGEGYYLNAPFLVESSGIARELLRNPSMRETVDLFGRCNVAISGIGSTDARIPALSGRLRSDRRPGGTPGNHGGRRRVRTPFRHRRAPRRLELR